MKYPNSFARAHGPGPMACFKCNSTGLKKVSLIYAEGTREIRGWLSGLILGLGPMVSGQLFGRFGGTGQNRLSASLSPPRKMPLVDPIILWLLGFFAVMAFAGRGKLSWTQVPEPSFLLRRC